jgi:outer membrane protein assembly factor BamB
MKIIWKFDLKGARSVTQRSPILSDDHVIVTMNHGLGANFQGVIAALCTETGVEKWRFERPHYFSQPVLSGEGSILVTGFDGWAHKIAPDGHVLWSKAVSERNLWAGILQAGKFVFPEILGGSQYSWALDAQTGEVAWRYESGGHSYGMAFDNAGSVLIASTAGTFEKTSHHLHKVDIETGARAWKASCPDVLFKPVVLEGLVIAGSRGRIAGLNLSDGAAVAEKRIGGTAGFSLNAPARNGRVFLASDQGHILALTVVTKRGLFGGASISLPAAWDIRLDSGVAYFSLEQNRLICLTDSGHLCLIDPDNGTQLQGARLPQFEKGMGVASLGANGFLLAVNRTCSRVEI